MANIYGREDPAPTICPFILHRLPRIGAGGPPKRRRRKAMHLRDEAKQPVRPRDFWVTVGAVLVIACLICRYTLPTKYAHTAEICFWSGSLAVVWGTLIWDVFRFGRRALPWPRIVLAIGMTLVGGQYLWPHAPAAVTWANHAGTLLVLVGALAPWFSSDPRPKSSSNTS